MSLNGLESPAIHEAYQAAIAEAGGWLLLNYASRDSVELLGRGKGGVHEARTAIAKYEDASPVYGVIVYRRRKVLIKYIPDGTSRVLLARTAVHLQDVLEKFAPYEALLEISTPDGLNDTSLAASFPLHTATPSGSSSRLDEITEDGEDPGPARATAAPSPSTRMAPGSYFASQRHKTDRRVDQRMQPDRSPTESVDSSRGGARPTSPLSSIMPSPMKNSVSQFLVRSDSGKPSITSLGSDSAASVAEYTPSEASLKDTQSSLSTVEPSKPSLSAIEPLQPDETALSPEPSFSETSVRNTGRGDGVEVQQPSEVAQTSIEKESRPTRPSTSEQSNYENDLLDFLKPKVKLGPRPVTAGERAKRPTKATVSSMPATYRFSFRKQEQPRQTALEQISTISPVANKPLPVPPPIPETSNYNPRELSRGSIKSMPSQKSTIMTPDKLRLMKAVELRKRQLRKSNPLPEEFVLPLDEEAPEVPKVPEHLPMLEHQMEVTREPELPTASHAAQDSRQDTRYASYKADSGIEMDYEKSDIQKNAEIPKAPLVQDSRRISSERIQQPSEDLPAPQPPKSPKLAIPGAFSDTTTPETEVEPTLEPTVDTTKDKEETIALVEDSVASAAADGPLATPSPEEDPLSIPTIVMADGSRPISSHGQQTKEDDFRSVESDFDRRSGDESMGSSGGLAAVWEMSPKRRNSDLARRRQGYIEPLHVDTDSESSDDDFMDELQVAQVVEAKHITVSRSPVQEFFQRRPSARSQLSNKTDTPKETQAGSPTSEIAVDDSANVVLPFTEPTEEPAATYRPTAPTAYGNEPPPSTGLKRNVSSEISKRIQALAGTSNREITPTGGQPLTLDTSPSTILSSTHVPTHVRNRSFNALTRYSAKANANQNQTTISSPQQSQSGPVWSVQHDPNTNRESVSVTARIVRPRPSEDAEPYNNADTELHQSQLSISHRRGMSSQTATPQLQRIDTKSEPTVPKQETGTPLTATALTGTSPTFSRISKETPRFSQPKAATSPLADSFSPPSPISSSSVPISTNDENIVSKESKRTSRFFKRMSYIGGKRRSGIQHPTEVNNQPTTIARAPSKDKMEIQSIMLPAIVVGDLNIQFPDSLLWKRRILAIDDAGYMNFQPTEHQKASTRRFRLAEFKMPYVPDLDRQELPNSIMLDFIDGTTLQIACEDSVTHLQVSHVLKTYWRAWARTA